MSYRVELEEGVWLAPWDGDPGLTVVEENAVLFRTRLAAVRAAYRIKRRFDHLTRIQIKEATDE